MCTYKVIKQNLKKKYSSVVRDSTERPKIRRLRVKDTAKTNKD